MTPSQYREIVDGVEKLADRLTAQDTLIEMLIEQIAETQLRVRYVMESIKYKDPAGLIVSGQPPPQRSLYEIYVGGDRERFLAVLQEHEHARKSLDEERRREEAEQHSSGSGSNGEGAKSDSSNPSLADALKTLSFPAGRRH